MQIHYHVTRFEFFNWETASCGETCKKNPVVIIVHKLSFLPLLVDHSTCLYALNLGRVAWECRLCTHTGFWVLCWEPSHSLQLLILIVICHLFADLPCLLSVTQCLHIVVHSLPGLKPLMDVTSPYLRDSRYSKQPFYEDCPHTLLIYCSILASFLGLPCFYSSV